MVHFHLKLPIEIREGIDLTLRERILRGDYLIGTHITTGDFITADIFARCGFDFIWIDTEHSCMDYRTLLSCVSVIRARGVSVIVRVQNDTFSHTKRVLEMGVDGIVFPNVDTEEQARRAVASCLYPPTGIRGFGPLGSSDYGLRDSGEYIRNCGNELAILLQVESATAVDNLEKICQVEHADGFVLGPCDLSGSLGCLGDIYSEKELAAVRRMLAVLKKHGKYPGISFGMTKEDEQRFWIDLGFRFISSGADYDYLRESALRNAGQLRSIVADRG